MKKIFAKGILGYIAALFFIIGLSWIITCGIIKLITLCFGVEFSWAIATGIWLCLALLGSVFGHNKK